MNIFSLLAESVDFPMLTQGFQIGLDWLGQFAKIIIESVGSGPNMIGLGVIVFTLVLKAITLPFDIYQRVKMRKQTLIMRNMQDDLEKLQKQYANDKNQYSQKMMELYKKNGYSMFGACLPMIVSLVILIVAFQGFNAYSQYANLSTYEKMASAYNSAILEYGVDGCDYQIINSRDEQGKLQPDENGNYVLVWGENENKDEHTWQNGASWERENIVYSMYEEENGDKFLSVKGKGEDKFLFYIYSLETTDVSRQYQLDVDRIYAGTVTYNDKTGAEQTINAAKIDAMIAENVDLTRQTACRRLISDMGAHAAAKAYAENPPSFLWIRNIYNPDVSYSHPIQDYNSFVGSIRSGVTLEGQTNSVSVKEAVSETFYNNITSQMQQEKEAPNGYFIMIVISIGLMVLSQFITMKSQKESNKYQTVDGSGAKTQKIMMIMMPLIYAIFAFMYSAMFSIYMSMSSFIGILVTLLANLILDRVFRKKEAEAIKQKYTRTVPWKTKEENKKDKKNKKR